MSNSELKFYNTEQLADMLGVSMQTIYNYIKSKKLTAVKIGKEYRVAEADFMEFINSRKTN